MHGTTTIFVTGSLPVPYKVTIPTSWREKIMWMAIGCLLSIAIIIFLFTAWWSIGKPLLDCKWGGKTTLRQGMSLTIPADNIHVEISRPTNREATKTRRIKKIVPSETIVITQDAVVPDVPEQKLSRCDELPSSITPREKAQNRNKCWGIEFK